MQGPGLDRRTAMVAMAAGLTGVAADLARATATPGFAETAYAQAIVIDALASPGEFMPDAPQDAPLTAQAPVSYTHLTLPTNREV